MTTPNQYTPPDGAFTVGGGEWNYGQTLTESFTRSMFELPMPNPGNMLDLLRLSLERLPLPALQPFADFLGIVDGVFDSIGSAVDAILNSMIVRPLVQTVEAFGEFLLELWEDPEATIKKIAQSTISGLDTALSNFTTMWNQVGDIVRGIPVPVPISAAVGHFQDWWIRTVGRIQEAFDDAEDFAGDLWAGFLRTFGLGPKSSSDVANAAAKLSDQSEKSRDLGEWNNAILGVRKNKSIMEGVDETEESTFLMSDLFNGGTTPPLMNVTSAAVPIAFWRASEWAKKGFISWFGQNTTGPFAGTITGMYVDIYKMNYTTSTMVLLHSSANIVGLADGTWRYLTYYLPEVNRFEVLPGDVIGVGLRVVGTGVHQIAAKSAPWLPAHPTVVPAKPSATRTGSGNLPFGSITYSTDLPWFGIGIVSGDTPPLFFTPRTEAFSTTGANTYVIPSWAQFLDVAMVGAGGGGHGGNNVGVHGTGGNAGVWVGETLVRGVDFPVGATTLTINVGGGGAGGSGNPSSNGGNGTASSRAAIASGKAIVSAAGGTGGAGLNTSLSTGKSPGNFTYGGTTFVGGGTAASNSASNGQAGKTPGGGGGGGAGGFFGAVWAGGAGGRGGAWITARQS